MSGPRRPAAGIGPAAWTPGVFHAALFIGGILCELVLSDPESGYFVGDQKWGEVASRRGVHFAIWWGAFLGRVNTRRPKPAPTPAPTLSRL